jgi:hypothetical protein
VVKPPTTNLPQIIVNTVSARIKSQPNASSTELRRTKLGTIYNVLEKKTTWYRVQFTSGNKTVSGWMPSTAVDDYDANSSGDVSAEIIDRYYAADGLSFTVASELSDFLKTFKNSTAELGLKRLISLRQALKVLSQPPNKDQQAFLKVNEKDVVYSEPAGEWHVRSELFWDLHKKFKQENIAWEAAKNPLPGECEGYVNCYLFYAKQTDGEYLNLYPDGKNALEALMNITNLLEPIVQDLETKSVYVGPTDVSDRAEFNQTIADLRSIISRLGFTEKEKPLQQLEKIAEGFR